MAAGEGVKLSMDITEDTLRPYLKEMMRRGMDLRPYWKRLGAWMAYRSVEKTFKVRGRPKWEPLSDYTIAMRKWRAESPKASPHHAFTRKILEVTGGLRGSFTFHVRPKELDVGTAHEGADAHQFGKWIKAPKRWERPMAKVPKRQLIGIHAEDEDKAVEFAIRYLEKG